MLFPCRQRVTASSEFLVDNPIYKTTTSSTSLISSAENGVRSSSRSRTLRTMGSEATVDTSPTNSTSKLTAADNPQYGTHLAPPPTQKPPRYIKVNTGAEPMYELIKGSQTSLNGAGAAAGTQPAPSGTTGGDPVYSTPGLVKGESGVPLYESTMDIPTAVGADGEYAKLNHNK